MAIKKTRVHNPKEILFKFKEKGIPFFLEQTMFTKKITSKYGVMEFLLRSNLISKKDLGFIGLVKKYCEKNRMPFLTNRKKIEYIFDGKLKKNYELKKDLFEIDLTGAYWNFAFQEKAISSDIYLRGLEVDKKVRLIALGNLAKRTLELEFNGKEYIKNKFRHSLLTENVFFHVSYLTDLLMKKLIVIANDSFLFYWVDAIFVQGEKARDEIIEYLNSEEIKHKVIKLNSVRKLNNKVITKDESHVNLKKDKKTGLIINEFGERCFNFRKTDSVNLIKREVFKGKEKTNLDYLRDKYFT